MIPDMSEQTTGPVRPWFISEHLHPLMLPTIFVCVVLSYFAWLLSSGEGAVAERWMSRSQLWGVAMLFAIVPAYFQVAATFLWRRSSVVLRALAPHAPGGAIEAVREQLLGSRPWVWSAGLLGGLFGFSQYRLPFAQLSESQHVLLDVSLIAGNICVWMSAALLLAWRLPVSQAFNRLGAQLQLDLYRLDRVKPLARMATMDLLVVMGVLAMLPLQALDAEFRWESYEAGLIFGLPSALVLFALPLWGVHRNIMNLKARRVAELNGSIDGCERGDIAGLEQLASHRDRVEALSDWPIDTRILTRALAYLVIPPLAWVGAALVERLVDRAVG
jgi:hypothetical protein